MTEEDDPRTRARLLDDMSRARAYMATLAAAGTAAVQGHPASTQAFHELEIEGVCFRGGFCVDGLYLARRTRLVRGQDRGWVQLGVARVLRLDEKGWWVCKYGPREPRIGLSGLSPAGIRALAREFGLPMGAPSSGNDQVFNADSELSGLEWALFYLSPSFESLRQWAKAHPRLLRSRSAGPYLPDWPALVASLP